MSTYRERREAKAERLRLWADGREAKADAAYETARRIGDAIPFGQPILVGHHSERGHRRDIARIDGAMGASVEHSRKAGDMRSRADNIEAANASAIYSDDPDALEQLRAKLAKLEAQRERIKAYNRTCKAGKPHGDLTLLEPAEAADLAGSIKVWGDIQCKNGRFPGYTLRNLGGVITTTRKRIEQLSRPETGRRMTARFDGECRTCSAAIEKGETITYYRRTRSVDCESCGQ